MTKALIHAALLFVFLATSFGDEAASAYNAGNAAYRRGDYSEAVDKYLEAVRLGALSPELFYNLGNAYFRLGDIGRAILWYERARMLAPRDNDIRKNLNFARKLVKDKITPLYSGSVLGFFGKALETISFREFWWLMVLLSSLATIATVFAILQLRGKWLALWLWIAFAVACFGWYVKCNRLWELRLAVVVAPKVDVRSEPSESGQLLFTLHAGTRVAIKEVRGGWYRIVLEDGNTGWLPREAAEKVVLR